MAADKRDQYGRDLDSWIERSGGRIAAVVIVLLVVWGAVVVFG